MTGAAFLSLGFWLLMTGDFTPDNILIGAAGAAAAARLPKHRVSLRRYLLMGVKVLAMIPSAYGQALKMMILPHRRETTEWEPGDMDPWTSFEQIFIITLTPRTLVIDTDQHGKGRVRVHSLKRKVGT